MKKVALLSLAAASVSAFTFPSPAKTSRQTSHNDIVPPLPSPGTKSFTTKLYANTDADLATIHRNADATFAVIDVDGGGTLSRSEFAKHLSVSGYNDETISKIFNKMDVNKDDEISREEFRNGMVMLAALQNAPGLGSYNAEFVKEIYEDADQVFQSADRDGNGVIDREELREHMGRSFADYSEGAIDEIFRCIDVNDDSTITKGEVKVKILSTALICNDVSELSSNFHIVFLLDKRTTIQDEFRDAFLRSSALRQALGEGPNYK